ncbi:hypothetical protein TcCL_ESM02190 [Trypanosoma cruzi]|nr:hypothetical protein TcCL_ESM02190 [Trypanosoma cruzi]
MWEFVCACCNTPTSHFYNARHTLPPINNSSPRRFTCHDPGNVNTFPPHHRQWDSLVSYPTTVSDAVFGLLLRDKAAPPRQFPQHTYQFGSLPQKKQQPQMYTE